MSTQNDLQKEFQKFHDRVKLTPEDNTTLREKRDRLATDMQTWLDENWEKLYPEKKKPTFSTFNQGSYAMGTGVKAASQEEDHDIDVGFMFNISKDDYKPEEVKDWVAQALTKGARQVDWLYPCIRVQYTKGGDLDHHVDVTTYVAPDENKGKTYIAKARNTTYTKPRIWEETDPKSLLDEFKESEVGESKKQRQRVIRGLKRWKDIHFASGNGRPIGIALTACALEWFELKEYYDTESKEYKLDDLASFLHLVTKMLNNFKWVQNDKKELYERLEVRLSIPPKNDLFGKMNQQQMENFHTLLKRLKQSLTDAQKEKDIVKACTLLNKEFGEDFYIPDPPEDVKNALNNGTLGIGVGQNIMRAKPNGGFHGGNLKKN